MTFYRQCEKVIGKPESQENWLLTLNYGTIWNYLSTHLIGAYFAEKQPKWMAIDRGERERVEPEFTWIYNGPNVDKHRETTAFWWEIYLPSSQSEKFQGSCVTALHPLVVVPKLVALLFLSLFRFLSRMVSLSVLLYDFVCVVRW